MATFEEFITHVHTMLYPLWSSLRTNYPKVPFDHIVGIVYNEDTILDPKACRFEPGVYKHVLEAKMGHRSPAFPGFELNPIHKYIFQYSIDSVELKSLATSYGLGQIMGYTYLGWGMLPTAYMNLSLVQSLQCLMKFYTLILLRAAPTITHPDLYDNILHIWNTGSVGGKTFNPAYVADAKRAADAWSAAHGKA